MTENLTLESSETASRHIIERPFPKRALLHGVFFMKNAHKRTIVS